jgi:DNA replication protein DnaC
VLYYLVPRLIEELRISHGDGSYIKFLKTLSAASLIVLDDWGLTHCQPRIVLICWRSWMTASTQARP